jgi:hypothetical protein
VDEEELVFRCKHDLRLSSEAEAVECVPNPATNAAIECQNQTLDL